MISPLYIPGNRKSPEIRFNPNGELWITGSSIQEDAHYFYYPLFQWLEAFLMEFDGKISLHIQLEYHNDSASKQLIELIRLIEKGSEKRVVYWYYEDWDEEILFLGETMRCLFRIPFKLIVR